MRFWQIKESKRAGGYFLYRDRIKDGKPDGVEYSGEFYKKFKDAQNACTIKNDGVVAHKERKMAEMGMIANA